MVGRPDELTGEAVCAFVVLKGPRPTGDDAKKIAKELRDWVGEGDRRHRQAQGHPLRRQPAEDALGQDHAAPAALDRQGRGDQAGRVHAGEPGDPRAAEAVHLAREVSMRRRAPGRRFALIAVIMLVACAGRHRRTQRRQSRNDFRPVRLLGFQARHYRHDSRSLDRISIRMGGRGERVLIYHSGIFIADDPTPENTGSMPCSPGMWYLLLPAGRKMEIAVGPGEIRYIGTYKVTINDMKLFSRTGGSFTRPIAIPTSASCWSRYARTVKLRRWEPKIERLIAQKRKK